MGTPALLVTRGSRDIEAGRRVLTLADEIAVAASTASTLYQLAGARNARPPEKPKAAPALQVNGIWQCNARLCHIGTRR